jgi:hypothetical protein
MRSLIKTSALRVEYNIPLKSKKYMGKSSKKIFFAYAQVSTCITFI